ncbi:hypothetical protein C3K47_13010 [Solitalea longa]|uniref:YbbR-like domain-containing protein n=1 Tax=Solitalea longa TaxID=2079460 RepID=A0A2S5A1H3_9SPHI|nr:hypothetical protein [Solitalea longa]POY36112.1 hypothetical protein C3K47_13010 [Solitalea longa]
MTNKERSLFDLNKRERRKLGLFFICLFFAICFWLISSLSNKYFFKVNTQLLLTNIPADRTLNVKTVEEVVLNVEGTGWQLLFSRINLLNRPLKIDISKIADSNILLYKHLEALNRQLPKGIKIKSIKPEIINLDFSSRIVKKIPLELLADITFKKQYFYSSDLILNPDSVTISGPIDEVAKVKGWVTRKIVLHDLADSVKMYIRLDGNQTNNITIKPSLVMLSIPVEKYTEGSIMVKLHLANNDRNYDVNLLPGKINIRYLCPVNKYPLVDEDMFYAQVDLNQWKTMGRNRLDVKLLRSPDFIRVININPHIIDFLVAK